MIKVEFENRDFSMYPNRHWDSLEVERYSKAAIGGPLKATLWAYGSEEDVWKFVEMLRCSVKLYDGDRGGKIVWWGYIDSVEVHSKAGVVYGVDIDTMHNKARVAYTYDNLRETTAWSSDADSVAEYGTKEILFTTSDKSSAQADRYRDTELEKQKYPSRLPIKFGSPTREAKVRINCNGWVYTLGWRYYLQNKGKTAYEDIDGFQGRELGEDERPYCAQSFKSNASGNWTASQLWARFRTVGSPTDNVTLGLYANNAGVPGALLKATENLAYSDMEKYHDWYEFDLVSDYTIVPGTLYWIRASRTGATVLEDYYMVDGNAGKSYKFGELKLWTGSAWVDWDIDMDMNFRVVGEKENAAQIEDCVDSVGEFIESVNLASETGVKSSPYRNGDSKALYEIEELLKVGTVNNRRLLVDISPTRVFKVYEEFAIYSDDYFVNSVGIVTDKYDNLVAPADCPVAYWAHLKGIIPVSVDVSKLISPTSIFVEEAEFNVRNNSYRILQSRDAESDYTRITKWYKDG